MQEHIDQDGGKLASLLSKITSAYEEYVSSMLNDENEVAVTDFKVPEDTTEAVQEVSKESSEKTPYQSMPASERMQEGESALVKQLRDQLEAQKAINYELANKEGDKNQAIMAL